MHFAVRSIAALLVVALGTAGESRGSASQQPDRKISPVYYLSGELFSETNLFSDKYNGFYRTYHKNGQVSQEIRYKDGWQIYDKAFDEQGQPLHRSGPVRTYYGDGTLASVGEYQNDMKNGTETYYYYDGKSVTDIWHYMDGRQVGSHIRNDPPTGRFISEDDWGYPTSYVERLRRDILGLIGLCLVLAVTTAWFAIRGAKTA